MIPGMADIMLEGGEKEASKIIKVYLCKMDSMAKNKLNCRDKIDENIDKIYIYKFVYSNSDKYLMILIIYNNKNNSIIFWKKTRINVNYKIPL